MKLGNIDLFVARAWYLDSSVEETHYLGHEMTVYSALVCHTSYLLFSHDLLFSCYLRFILNITFVIFFERDGVSHYFGGRECVYISISRHTIYCATLNEHASLKQS